MRPAPPEFPPLPLPDALPFYGVAPELRNSLNRSNQAVVDGRRWPVERLEEHTSELQSQSNLLFLLLFFILCVRLPPSSPLSPYPTLSRSTASRRSCATR